MGMFCSGFGQFELLALGRLKSMCFPLLWFVIGLKSKEVRNRFSNSTCHSFEFSKGRCVPSALDETQKIDRDAKNFREFLLRLVRFVSDLSDPESELFL